MRATKFKIKPFRVFRVFRGSIIIYGIKNGSRLRISLEPFFMPKEFLFEDVLSAHPLKAALERSGAAGRPRRSA